LIIFSLWIPLPSCIVPKTYSNTAGPLVFVDCSQEKEITLLNVQEHQGMTDLEWDPTGRFVVSMVSSWDSSSRGADYGFLVWNFQVFHCTYFVMNVWQFTFLKNWNQGRMLARRQMPGFCSFSWRPRPATLLNEEKIKVFNPCVETWEDFILQILFQAIRKNMKKYAMEFDEKDRKKLDKASQVGWFFASTEI